MCAARQIRWRRYSTILVAGLSFATVLTGCSSQSTERPEPRPAPAVVKSKKEPPNKGVKASLGGPAAEHKPLQHNKPAFNPTDPASTSATSEEQLEEAVNHLRVGGLAYSFPKTMKTGQQDDVVASIGSDKVPVAALQAHVAAEAGQDVKAEPTPITTKMKMTLTSADFDITRQSSDEQMVVGSTPTTWRWTIAPKHSGELHLHLAAIIELENLQQDYTTVDRDVAVQVDPLDATEKFIENNWQWLLSSGGGVAVVGTIWGFFRRKKV